MDRVRFGRALGFGTRQAIKTLVSAVDAATADNPSAKRTPPNQTPQPSAGYRTTISPASRIAAQDVAVPLKSDSATRRAVPSAAKTAAQTGAQPRQAKQRMASKRLGQAVWEPFVRLSGVLWLEVTGVFFGLFALVALGFLWKLRGAWRANPVDTASRHSLVGAAIMFAVFGYFCISSFVRAHRRERRR